MKIQTAGNTHAEIGRVSKYELRIRRLHHQGKHPRGPNSVLPILRAEGGSSGLSLAFLPPRNLKRPPKAHLLLCCKESTRRGQRR